MMLNPAVILSLALAFFLAIGGAYFKGKSDGYKIQEGEQARINRLAEQVYEQAQKATATEIAKIKVTNTTVRQVLEKEIHEKPVYVDCRHSADGLRAINTALSGTSVSANTGELPRIEFAP